MEPASPRPGTRCAILTGGASGIGRALAEELALRGVHVVLADRQLELAEEVATGIRERGGSARATELDVRDLERFRQVVKDTWAETGRLDYLFNNAGIGAAGEMREYEPGDWDEVIDVNLRGVTNGLLAAYPQMIAQGFGHIVNTASMAGLMTGPAPGSYVATKHAVVALSRALRMEARDFGVKVSVLCPGVIRTPILEGGRYGRFEDFDPSLAQDRWERMRPMDPRELARRTLRDLDRDRGIIVHPRWWKVFWYLDRLSPWLVGKIGERMARGVRRDMQEARRRASKAAPAEPGPTD